MFRRRFSALVVKKTTPWDVKQQEREKKKMTKELVKHIKEEKAKTEHVRGFLEIWTITDQCRESD